MVNISGFLKNAFSDLIEENRRHPVLIFVIIALLAIPLPYAFNSISLALLLLATAVTFRRFTRCYAKPLLLLISLYLLMALSLLWTIDLPVTVTALQKELPLLLVPVAFMIFGGFSAFQKDVVVKYYAWGMAFFAGFYLVRAAVRFLVSNDVSAFFYHGLVSMDVNAIHVSVYFSVAFFAFYRKANKSIFEWMAALLLLVSIFLLSSKNITLLFLALLLAYHFFYAKPTNSRRILAISLVLILASSLMFVGKIRERFSIEMETMFTDSTVNHEISKENEPVYNVSLSQAWNKETFAQNDFFPGMALRIFQIRIFCEMLQEDGIFFTGYGLNASYPKIRKKVIQHNLYQGGNGSSGYQGFNFHNQYVQNFAELGIFGFLLLILILAVNLKNALKSKDFVHISFAILMISLFLTESFLWRQRGVTFFVLMFCLLNSGTGTAPNEKTL